MFDTWSKTVIHQHFYSFTAFASNKTDQTSGISCQQKTGSEKTYPSSVYTMTELRGGAVCLIVLSENAFVGPTRSFHECPRVH